MKWINWEIIMNLTRRIYIFCGICWSIITVVLLLCGQKTPVPHVAVTEFLAASTADVPSPSLPPDVPTSAWQAETTIAPQQGALNRDRLVFSQESEVRHIALPAYAQVPYSFSLQQLYLPSLADITGMLPFSQAPPVLLF